ncbi:hypothetical protein QL886_05440 [Psychrobacter sp. APC 3281]|uniref:hypothetical protein n=1 Tax=Psychrobacter sp. APC 3281 TaxID=3035190 RepID=UPI0025B2941F|nr:hypothetical protein [Psychrobacter sp. APC 3281]MDN3447081.1 hypothetical protein [Psychrobacter sp. APC 3281]
MSSHHTNNRNRQRYSETAPACLSNTDHKNYNGKNNNGHLYPTSKLTSIALLVGSASLVLAGCQSTPASSTSNLSSNSSASSTMMDFSVANAAQSQRQGQAFTVSQNAQAARYEQLFDQEKYPSTENQAKSHLLAAIRQHLATEHVAVATANYRSAPFIDPNSIDAGSSSLLRTIIETYVYQPEGMYDSSDDEAQVEARAELAAVGVESNKCNENEDDDAYEVCVVEGIDDAKDSIESDYPSDYDKSRAEAEAERRAIAAILAEAGENEPTSSDASSDNEYAYDIADDYSSDDYSSDDYDNYDEYSSGAEGMLSGMSGLSPKSMAAKYEAMQMAKQQAKTETVNRGSLPMSSTGMIGNILDMFHRTPEQIAASNAYQYEHLTFNSVSQYRPKQRQLQSVYSYDYATPTISSSIQIPLAFDFNNSSVVVDPSAIMPIVALVNPENTPLPSQMTSHTVRFGLPESITAQLPPAVLYDAVLNAIQNSMAELAPEHFSAVDISGDAFAKEVGATRAVKVYFGSQQSGEMIGKTLKYVTKSLQEYVDANPDKYPDGAALKTALAKVQLYNKGYQSADVGSLLQLIEAIGPISFNQINYYYLDSSDRLLAKQQRVNIGSDFMGSTTTMLNQVRYDKASFNRHALTPLLTESFGPDATPPIDGNAWIATQREKKERLQTARYARYDYQDSGVEGAYSGDEYGNDRDNGTDAVDESRVDDAQDDMNEK